MHIWYSGQRKHMEFCGYSQYMDCFGWYHQFHCCEFPVQYAEKCGKAHGHHLQFQALPPGTALDIFTDFAQVARRDGLLALESRAAEVDDPF